jgi:hypothetical protein
MKIFAAAILHLMLTATLSAGESGEKELAGKRTGEEKTATEERRGCLPGAVAIFPGVIVHGAGHYAAGDRDTATDLMLIETVSLFTFLGASAYYAYTGASRKVSPFMVPLIAAGSSVFLLSWIADLYGSRPGERRGLTGPLFRSGNHFEPFLGITTVNDRQFDYSGFYHYGFRAEYYGLHLKPMAWDSVDTDNRRYQVEGGYELVGETGPLLPSLGDFLETGPLFRSGYHDFGDDGFRKTWIDAGFFARLMPGGIWPSMKGSFFVFELGYNREWVRFTEADDAPVLASNQMLFESGFGIERGTGGPSGVMFYLYYNHRRDGFTGGLSAGNYVTITGTSAATARRDLAELVDMGGLVRTGERKGTRYWLPFETAVRQREPRRWI